MFNINHRPTFTVDVALNLPGLRDGQTLKTTFRALPDEEVKTFGIDPEGMKDFLRKVIVSFDDLGDDDGNPIAHSDTARDDILDFSHMRTALHAAYWAAIFKVRSGN